MAILGVRLPVLHLNTVVLYICMLNDVHGVYSRLSNWWKIDFHRENFHGLLTATAKGYHATKFRRENIAIKAWYSWKFSPLKVSRYSVQDCVNPMQGINDISCFRICSESETQTKREKGTSVPKSSTYIAGLRGRGVLPPQKVDLILPVDTHNNITSWYSTSVMFCIVLHAT